MINLSGFACMTEISLNFQFHHDWSRGSCIQSFDFEYYSGIQITCYLHLDCSVQHGYLRFLAPARPYLNIYFGAFFFNNLYSLMFIIAI